MKQSSIEWLIENLHLHNDVYFVTKNKRDIIKQAKAMHKEEIIEAYDDGWLYNNQGKYNPEQYYNETFGGEDESDH